MNRWTRRSALALAAWMALSGASVRAGEAEGLYGSFWKAVSMPHREVHLLSKMYENILEVKVLEGQKVKKDNLLIQYQDRSIQSRIEMARREADLEAVKKQAELRIGTFGREYRRLVKILGSVLLAECDIDAWPEFCGQLAGAGSAAGPKAGVRLWALLPAEAREVIKAGAGRELTDRQKTAVVGALNMILSDKDFYREEDFADIELPDEARALLDDKDSLELPWKVRRLNRLLLEAAFPGTIVECGEGGQVTDVELEQALYRFEEAKLLLAQHKADEAFKTAQLHVYETEAKDYRIMAPIDGVIARLDVESGQTAREGDSLLTIIDARVIEIHVHLPERYIPSVQPGQRVEVAFPEHSKEDRFEGKVSNVAPQVNPNSGLFQVTVLVEPGVEAVKPGASCEVMFLRRGAE